MSASVGKRRPAALVRSFEGDARRELLLVLVELGALTAEALASLLGAGVPSVRGRLAATERAGLTRSWRLLRDAPTLHTATARGVRAAGLSGLRPVRIGPGSAAHATAMATAAAGLARAFPDVKVMGEPAIRSRERERGAPTARLAGRNGGHRPDLLLMPAQGCRESLPVAIEVELTVKAPERLAAICVAWARSRQVSGTIYLASPAVLGALSRAIAKAGAEDRVVALALDAFGSAIADAA